MLQRIKSFASVPLIKNSLKLSSSNVILYALPFLVTPILSRLYGPDFFGDWGVFGSTFSIISVVMFASYDNAIVRSETNEVKSLSLLCFLVGTLTTLLTVIAFTAGSYFEIPFFDTFPYEWLLYAYLFLHVFTTVLQNMLNREKQYGSLAICSLLLGGSQALFRILWGYLVRIGNGLIIGTVLANFSALAYLTVKIRSLKNITSVRYADTWKEIKATAVKYKKFPIFDAPALLMNFAAFNLPVIILSFFFPKSDIGCYSLIIQLLVLPISFIGSAIGKVYYQEISAAYSESNEQLIKTDTLRILKLLSILSVLPGLFICLGGDQVIVWFLGERWETAGGIAICLAIWSIPTILTEPFKPIFRVFNKQNVLFKIELMYFLSSVITLIIGCKTNMGLYNTLFFFAATCSLVKALFLLNVMQLSKLSLSSFGLIRGGLIVVGIILVVIRYLWL